MRRQAFSPAAVFDERLRMISSSAFANLDFLYRYRTGSLSPCASTPPSLSGAMLRRVTVIAQSVHSGLLRIELPSSSELRFQLHLMRSFRLMFNQAFGGPILSSVCCVSRICHGAMSAFVEFSATISLILAGLALHARM